MKTIFKKRRLGLLTTTLIIVGTGAYIIADSTLAKTTAQFLNEHEITASIIYSALFILGFNILIFAIGYFAKDKVKKAEIIRKAYMRGRANRRRKLESRQFSVLSNTR